MSSAQKILVNLSYRSGRRTDAEQKDSEDTASPTVLLEELRRLVAAQEQRAIGLESRLSANQDSRIVALEARLARIEALLSESKSERRM